VATQSRGHDTSWLAASQKQYRIKQKYLTGKASEGKWGHGADGREEGAARYQYIGAIVDVSDAHLHRDNDRVFMNAVVAAPMEQYTTD